MTVPLTRPSAPLVARRPPLRVLAVLTLAVLLVAAGALLLLAAVSSWQTLTARGPLVVEDAVTLVAATTGAGVAGWLGVAGLVATLDVVRGHARSALVPVVVHALVLTALGLAAAPAGAAVHAAHPQPSGSQVQALATADSTSTAPTRTDPARTDTSTQELPEPGWHPARPPTPPKTASPADPLLVRTPRAAATTQEQVVVRRGDTLWDLASRHLGPAASDAEIAASWPRWYEANAATIGADPDLLLPGQVLRPPS